MAKTTNAYRWGYCSLSIEGKSTLEEREDIITRAIDMYLSNVDETNVRGETYEGRIKQTSGYQFVAPGFSGIEYQAEVENRKGKSKFKFLISEKVREELN